MERLKVQEPKNEIKRGKKFMVGYLGVIGQQGEHGHVIHAQRAGRGRFGLLVGRAADDQTAAFDPP